MISGEEQSHPAPGRGKLRHWMATVAAFAGYSSRRFGADGCFAASGALSYTTLVSLVPLAVIAFGTLSAFPIFAKVHDQLVALVFQNLVPSIGEQAAWWFRAFADSAAQTTAIGVAGIAATGVLLLVTVEDQLNLIWRVTSPRPWVQRILAYWTLITLGPLLIGISLSCRPTSKSRRVKSASRRKRSHGSPAAGCTVLRARYRPCSNSSL